MFLIRWLIRGLIKILGAIAQLVVLLVVKLGLWVPLVFAFGWLLVCAYVKIPLNDPAALNVLAVGCVAATVLGIAGAAYWKERRRENARRDKEERAAVRMQKNKYTGSRKTGNRAKPNEGYQKFREEEEEQGSGDNETKNEKRITNKVGINQLINDNDTAASDSTSAPVPYSTANRQSPSSARHSSNYDEAQYDRKYFGAPEKKGWDGAGKAENGYEAMPRAESARGGDRTEYSRGAPDFSDERPMVFATRKDPDIFIAEYGDRLLFYRKRRNGEPELIATEYKS